MSIRLARLESDYKRLKAKLKGNPYISIKEVQGDPPEHYVLEYRVRGLAPTGRGAGKVVERDTHLVEINLPRGYPHVSPKCKCLSPIFHPNIDDLAICIGDEWAASETLAQLVIRIGEMIAYQSYNWKSPVNKKAAEWTRRHEKELPIDDRFLDPTVTEDEAPAAVQEEITVEISGGPKDSAGVVTIRPEELVGELDAKKLARLRIENCSNCFADSSEVEIRTCVEGHKACRNCLVVCERCQKEHCLSCTLYRCTECQRLVCGACGGLCSACGTPACREHLIHCAHCRSLVCTLHAYSCGGCSRQVCRTHIKKCPRCRNLFCVDCASRPHECVK